MSSNEFKVTKGDVLNCKIKNVAVLSNGYFKLKFELTEIPEYEGLLYETVIKSNWAILEVVNYYKWGNNKFQVEFDGLDELKGKINWIIRKVD
jgi:hypothetical protein